MYAQVILIAAASVAFTLGIALLLCHTALQPSDRHRRAALSTPQPCSTVEGGGLAQGRGAISEDYEGGAGPRATRRRNARPAQEGGGRAVQQLKARAAAAPAPLHQSLTYGIADAADVLQVGG